jgi:TPR repeat protein
MCLRVQFYGLAAGQGHANGQFNLGLCLETGIAKDKAEAVRLYRLAAEQGHVGAQRRLNDCEPDGGRAGACLIA